MKSREVICIDCGHPMTRVECTSTCGCELEHYRKRHVWWYESGSWDPEHFRHRILYFGGDELHRRTVVLFSHLVVALWPFHANSKECDCFDD